MTTPSLQLLRQLGSGVRPGGAEAPAANTPGIQPGDFAQLLQKAQAGELTSTRSITMAAGSGVTLTDDQLAQLAVAADQAESAGIRTAAVLLDGQTAILDVANRTITGAASGQVLSGVDGVINLAQSSASGGSAPQVLPLGAGNPFGNPSLLEVLARRDDSAAAA